jgi:hypothetical protein
MKFNKVFKGILSSIGLYQESDIKSDYIETIGEVLVTSIVVGFEYIEKDFGIICKFRVTKDITKDDKGTWIWKALNLDTQLETDIKCMQEGKAYWPNMEAA